MQNKSNAQVAVQVSVIGICFNVLLTAFKLLAGIIANSAAMVSDSIHSLSDILGGTIVMIGVKLSNKESDKEHPYGHERFECVVAIILAIILIATGLGIGYGGLKTIFSGDYQNLTAPGLLALIAAIVSIVVKEGLFWYTKIYAKRINSTALMAEAWHHRSDAFSSIGSSTGILGARMGFPVLDSVACIIICVFIVKAGYSIFADAIKKMTDRACDDETVDSIRTVALEQESVDNVTLIKTRVFGDKIYVDVEISCDEEFTLHEAHNVAQQVHDAIEKEFPKVKHCMVHMNPSNKAVVNTAG